MCAGQHAASLSGLCQPVDRGATGHAPAAFYADPDLCLAVVAGADRRLLRRVLVSRRDLTLTLRLERDGVAIPVELRTVALVRRRRVVAIEGVARLAVGVSARSGARVAHGVSPLEPAQQRLAALLVEVHDLLHRVLPPPATVVDSPRLETLGDLTFDRDRLTTTERGAPVALTTREVQVLCYLLDRRGRVVSRTQLLQDVWGYQYTGDDRTVDVHISRLRRKLPSLRGRLTALRQIGYRLDTEDAVA